MAPITAPNLRQWQSAAVPPDRIGVQLHADNGTSYAIAIHRGQLGPFMAELVGRATTLPAPTQIETVPIQLFGSDAVAGPDGQIGISIRLAGGLRLTLSLTPEAITGLQVTLNQVAPMAKPPSSSSH